MRISFRTWQVLHHPATGMWRRVRWFGRWTPFIFPLKSQTADELLETYRAVMNTFPKWTPNFVGWDRVRYKKD